MRKKWLNKGKEQIITIVIEESIEKEEKLGIEKGKIFTVKQLLSIEGTICWDLWLLVPRNLWLHHL